MKKVILVFAFLYTPTLSLWAQTDKEVSLSEVNIIASKIIQKVDGKNKGNNPGKNAAADGGGTAENDRKVFPQVS